MDLEFQNTKRDRKGKFTSHRNGNRYKTVYLVIKKDDFTTKMSFYKKDLYDFLEISQKTFNKYLEIGEYKGFLIQKHEILR